MKKLPWLAALLLASTVHSQVIAPIDRQAVESIGESFARALNERDARAAADMIDLKSLATRAARVQEFGQADQDAYVHGVSLLRAAVYLVSGDFANTLKYSDESIAQEPDRLYGYDTRATALVRLERHADAVAAYRDMQSRFDLEFTRELFAADPTFEKFVASQEFRKWLPR